jgi:hypothetical protein
VVVVVVAAVAWWWPSHRCRSSPHVVVVDAGSGIVSSVIKHKREEKEHTSGCE